MGKVNIVARGLSVLQKATLDFAYKRRLERLERPPSRCGLSEFDFIPAHIVNYYYGFLGTYPWGSDGIVTGGNSFRTKGYSFRIKVKLFQNIRSWLMSLDICLVLSNWTLIVSLWTLCDLSMTIYGFIGDQVQANMLLRNSWLAFSSIAMRDSSSSCMVILLFFKCLITFRKFSEVFGTSLLFTSERLPGFRLVGLGEGSWKLLEIVLQNK